MDTVTYIAPWVLGSVCAGLAAGFLLGHSRDKGREGRIAERERRAALRMLVEVLTSAEQINTNVENHNSEIQENARHVKSLKVSGEMEAVRQSFLGQMTTLLR